MQSFFAPAAPYRIRHPSYNGTTHQLVSLPRIVDATVLSDMLANDQLVASVSGLSVAALFAEGEFVDCVQHNIPGIAEIYFGRQQDGHQVATRILDVHDDCLLVWGVHESLGTLGVYECSSRGVRLLTDHNGISSRVKMLDGNPIFPFPHDSKWNGKIEYVWQSPNERSLAWLYRPDGQDTEQQIFVNGRLLHQGRFEMTRSDFVWAPDGMTGAASIFSFDHYGNTRQEIVTPSTVEQIPNGFLLREFLVNCRGRVSAQILDDANASHPFIYDHANDDVQLAWNLHCMPDGSIGYNYIQQGYISHMTDESIPLR